MKRATILALLGLLLSVEPVSALESPRSFRRGEWESSVRAGYTLTDSNHTGSSSEALPNDGKFQLIDLGFRSRYVFSPTWALSGMLNFGNAESSSSLVTRSNSALTSGVIGVETLWEVGSLDLIPEASLLFPFEKVTAGQDTVMTSEGVMETLLNMNAQIAFRAFTLFGSLGYDMRGDGRSALLPWSVGVEFKPGRLRFGARLFGFESVTDDRDTGGDAEAARIVTINRANAGSMMFYGVNPSVVNSDISLTIGFNPNWDLRLGGGATLTGKNTAATYHGDATLVFRFSTVPIARRAREKSNMVVDPFVDQFKEDVNDGVDQKLFEPAPKSLPMKDPSIAPPPIRMKKERQKVSMDEQRAIQEKLDNAEMQIELKYNKKKKAKKKKN